MPVQYGFRVGGYVDAYCTRCRMDLGHTIIAMVDGAPKRVECNTCHSQHNYRAAADARPHVVKPGRETRTAKEGVSRAPTGGPRPAKTTEYMTLMSGRDAGRARLYAPSVAFERDELLKHASFGVGIVRELKAGGKIDVLFADGPRLLVHGR